MEPVGRFARVLILLLAAAAPGAGETGVFRQIALPSPNSRPTSILHSHIGLLFTEYDANKIGFLTRDGRLIEYSIPTPNSGPMDLDLACDGMGNCDVWFTEFLANKIGRLNPHTGEFREFTVPTSGSGPHSIVTRFSPVQVWFTEFHGNKIGHLTSGGQFTEVEIPTPASGPMGIALSHGGDEVWFTEFSAGKLGRVFGTGPVFDEIVIPTPSSGPTDLRTDSDGRIVFTEFLANKVGHVGYDNRTITETDLPTASSGPFRICKSFFRSEEVWFTERLANKMGVIRSNQAITEYEIPTAGAEPYGCSFDGLQAWFTQQGANSLASVQHDALVAVGAGTVDGWGTNIRYSNAESSPTHVFAGYYRVPSSSSSACPGPCVWQAVEVLPARGTLSLPSVGGFGPGPVIYTRSLDRGEVPTVQARASNPANAGRATDLPLARLSTISRLDPSLLVFPGAIRTGSSHSNLVIANLDPEAYLSVRIDALSPEGVLLASETKELIPAGYFGEVSFQVDVLGHIGVSELMNGQLRVTKMGTTGLLWGTLATVHDEAVFADSGRNLSLPDELAVGGDPLVVLGGVVGDWDTEFDVGNARAETLNGTIAILSCTVGANCPVPPVPFSVPPNGTTTLRARDFPAFPEGLHTYLVRFAGTGAAPTVRARVVNRARPSQTAVVPALHRSAIRKLESLPLSFPGGTRSASGARSNLVLGEVGRGDAGALVEVFDPAGNLLKTMPVVVSKGGTLFLQDVLSGAGAEFENAHVLVTKTGGAGTPWGMLATIDRNDALSVGWGVHP